jgi:hypothetical protein
MSFFIIKLNFIVYASPVGKNDNTEPTNKDNQQIKTKTKKYKWEFSSAASFYFEPEVYEKEKHS